MMSKIAIFPGSFDPFTVGHESIVLRAINLFDKIIIGIGSNVGKTTLFSVEQRFEMLKELFSENHKIEIMCYDGLTINFCKRVDARYILRGLRSSSDFEFEKIIAQVNREMSPEVETVFMPTLPEHTAISSSIVREILHHGGDVSKFVPKGINFQKFIKN